MWACASAFADASACGPCVERCVEEARQREEVGEDGGGSTLKTKRTDINSWLKGLQLWELLNDDGGG